MTVTSASSGSVRPIETRSLSEQVTNEIRRSILAGTLPPGQSLSLRRLADQLEVSFIPVRDALRVLEAEGLVVNPPGRSASVAPLDLEEFHSIYRVRRMLEPDLARRSAAQLADAELDRLYQAAAEFGGADRSMDDIYDDHRAFHLALLAPAASSWDIRILMMIWRASERYVRIGFGLLDPDPGEHERRREAHQLLVSEFRKRDPQSAARAVEDHLAHNEELARTALSGSGVPPITGSLMDRRPLAREIP
jgi:DNA-binding GntR family transcriptional regulator